MVVCYRDYVGPSVLSYFTFPTVVDTLCICSQSISIGVLWSILNVVILIHIILKVRKKQDEINNQVIQAKFF